MAAPDAYARRQFPGAAGDTTITAGIADSDLTCTLTSASGWPTGTYTGAILVEFYSVTTGLTLEKAWAESLSGTTLTILSGGRGADGTSAIAHAAGVGIRPIAGARDADEANKAAHETVGQITAAGQILVGDGANSLAAVQAKTSGQILVGNGTTLASVAVSGDATLSSAGALTLTSESVADIVGAMVTGNTETGITVTYQDADNTLDFEVAASSSVTSALTNLTSGSVATTSTSFAYATGLTVTIAATAGDVLQVALNGYATVGAASYFDVATYVSGAVVNYISGGASNGVSSWYRGSSGGIGGSPWQYVVQAGDISGGNVVLRVYFKVASGTTTISADANTPAQLSVINLG